MAPRIITFICLIAMRWPADESIGGVILGCTELPLILTKDEFGIPFLNTTEMHLHRIIDEYIKLSRNL